MSKRSIGVVLGRMALGNLFSPAAQARLEKLGSVRWAGIDAHPDEAAAIEMLKGCEIGIGSWRTAWPSENVVKACPDLKLWVHAAGSVKSFFGPHLEGLDLTIASCATAIGDNVAEMTLGLLIVGLKRVIENAQANRNARAGSPANSCSIYGSTIGIIGASAVGRRVIRNLRPFGADVVVFDPYLSDADAASMGCRKIDDLTELCAMSHAVSIHTPLLPATTKMLGAKQFAAMRDDAVFINTARGPCIDEASLIAELQKGRLFAYLDVSDPEPPAMDSPLRSLTNVVYTSHIAGGANWRIGDQAVSDVDAFLCGRTPERVVTRDQLERLA